MFCLKSELTPKGKNTVIDIERCLDENDFRQMNELIPKLREQLSKLTALGKRQVKICQTENPNEASSIRTDDLKDRKV